MVLVRQGGAEIIQGALSRHCERSGCIFGNSCVELGRDCGTASNFNICQSALALQLRENDAADKRWSDADHDATSLVDVGAWCNPTKIARLFGRCRRLKPMLAHVSSATRLAGKVGCLSSLDRRL
jgi:hypothetical protein